MQEHTDKKKPFISKAGVVLICGVLTAFFFPWGLPEILPAFWKYFTFLPDRLYFPAEEFFALQLHPNSAILQIAGVLLLLGTFFAASKISGRKTHPGAYILPAFLIIQLLLPCLCAPKEKAYRLKCITYQKMLLYEIAVYGHENNDQLPDKLPISTGHPVRYYGAGQVWREKPFVLLEDAPGTHAGDLRHQLWSDGKIRAFYPWKQERLCTEP